jgi:hypothetical protein
MTPGDPQAPMRALWKDFLAADPTRLPAAERPAREQLERFDASSRASILRDLQAIEDAAGRQEEPLAFLRRRLMDLMDRRVGSGELIKLACGRPGGGSAPGGLPAQSLDLVAADCDVQIAVLRAYARINFGDGGEDDWFAAYGRLSGFYHGLMAQGLNRPLPEWFEFDGRRYAATRANMIACRDTCLAAPPGRRFDLPPEGAATAA